MTAMATFTLNRFQFFGVITREYLDQMHPVSVIAVELDNKFTNT